MEGRLSGASPFLFPRVIGAGFAQLQEPVRVIHQRAGLTRYAGQVEVERGTGAMPQLFAAAARLPPAGCGPLVVDIESAALEERWTRRMGGHAMASRLWFAAGMLREQLGLVRFDFALRVVDAGIEWRVARVRALGVPLPVRWFSGVGARESARGERYGFDVWARLPGVGLLVHYRGWLDVVSPKPMT